MLPSGCIPIALALGLNKAVETVKNNTTTEKSQSYKNNVVLVKIDRRDEQSLEKLIDMLDEKYLKTDYEKFVELSCDMERIHNEEINKYEGMSEKMGKIQLKAI